MFSTITNRISYLLRLKGVSQNLDTACSTAMYAVDCAYKHMRQGYIDNAIVVGVNLTNSLLSYLNFVRLGLLSPNGRCKSFDEAANGYVRSEVACALFLQKAKNARRIYATIVHSKTNADGFKESGITFPSSDAQQQLLTEFYQECSIHPSQLSYLECHATGTRIGDPEELKAVDEVFCKSRRKPLKIGTVKSNIGHAEGAAGLTSIIKVILGMEEGFILPNINFKSPKKIVTALQEKRLLVITEKTEWEDTDVLCGISSFGFGGANAHALLRWNSKVKANQNHLENLPRLVCYSARNMEGIEAVRNELRDTSFDDEYLMLMNLALK